jgi:2-polyprenyl-6-methoxyphenol hydroxylase-like FAD-dependent oxidoreductase
MVPVSTDRSPVQDVQDPKDPLTWTFQLQTTWKRKEGEEITIANHKRRAETFGEPFRSANLWLPDDTVIYDNHMSYWKPVPWDSRNGRIILTGDAAHPMTFREYFKHYIMPS